MREGLCEVCNKLLTGLIPLFGQEPIAIHVDILPGRILPTGIDCHGGPDQRGVASRIAAVRMNGSSNLPEKSRGLAGPVADIEPLIEVRTMAHFRQPTRGPTNDNIPEQRGFIVDQATRLEA